MNNESADNAYLPAGQDSGMEPPANPGWAVPLGAAQPPQSRAIPVLQPDMQALDADTARHSTVAEGMVFEGNALLVGPCTRGRRVWQGGRASGLAAQAVLAELLVKRQQVHRGSARGQHAPHEIASSAQLRQLR